MGWRRKSISPFRQSVFPPSTLHPPLPTLHYLTPLPHWTTMQGMAEVWSVSELNRYVRQSLEKDFRLQGLRVAGEVSGFRAYPSGHWYFTLKDDAAQVSCVMWRNRAEKL